MNFKQVYELVEAKKNLSLTEMLREECVDLVYDNDLSHGNEAWSMVVDGVFMIYLQEDIIEVRERFLLLHELGHFFCDNRSPLSNRKCEESMANLFACLYLMKNQIWHDSYFYEYLLCNGCDKQIASRVNDQIYQYKLQVQSNIGWKLLELM